MRIVKKQEKDSKARFSYFEIELKNGVDISYPEIKVIKVKQKKQKTRINLVSCFGLHRHIMFPSSVLGGCHHCFS